jgi:hypothetical protein
MNRRVLIGIITSALQTMLYFFVFWLGWTIGTTFHKAAPMSISESVGLGVFLKFSINIFGIMMAALNLIDAAANVRRGKWQLLILATIFYVIYWGRGWDYTPLKTGLFVAAGLIAIYSKIPFEKLLNKMLSTRAQEEAS